MEKHILDSIDPIILGSRLQEARKSRGVTQQDVADHMDIARTTLVAIEKGERRLTPQELIKLAGFYGRTVSEFVGRQVTVEGFVPQFRTTWSKALSSSATAAASGVRSINRSKKPSQDDLESEFEKVAVELQCLAEDYVELENICGMPMVKAYPPTYNISGTTSEQAGEEVAAAERNRLGLGDGPLSNLRERLESDAGLRIFYFPMPGKVAGLFAYNDSLGGCIGINSNHPRDRRNWSLAHEYGHFLTSRYQPEITFLSVAKRSSAKERLADSFAECFLMPASGLNRRFSEIHRSKEKGISLADLITLADLYQVSVQALILRLENLKRLLSGTWDKLEREGFKVRQAQQMLDIEANPAVKDFLPLRYKALAVSAYNQDELSEEQLAKYLRTDRVHARLIVDEISHLSVAGKEGEFGNLQFDLAESVGR
ncbi:MAG: ImmA/IrrE family metallo-endopeptidase [Acidobacteria bacterium]|nr:ImmA/IrrE family metallo-endopeptidase [Acidobacteriota bacterium]